MSEKETKDMLVRSVPLNVWEKIKKTCERKQMKHRDGAGAALDLLRAK